MKTQINKQIKKIAPKVIVLVLMFSILIAPFSSYAIGVDINAKLGGDVCAKIAILEGKVNSKIEDKENKFVNKKDDRVKNLGEKRNERDVNRQENRAERDDKVDARITALMAKADTDAKKTAVNNFSLAVKNAISVRRDSVNSAVATFRLGVDNLIKNKFGLIDNNAIELKNAIDLAFTKAKTSCQNGTDENTIKATLRSSIKTALDEFKSDKSDTKIKAEIEALADARKASIDSAIAKFKIDMEKAKVDLKAVMGN